MYIYGVFEGYIQQYSAVTEVFFIRRKKKSRGNVFAENDKNRGWCGYVDVYSTTRPHVYNKYPICMSCIFLSFFVKSAMFTGRAHYTYICPVSIYMPCALCTEHIYEYMPAFRSYTRRYSLRRRCFNFFGLCTIGILTKNYKNILGI